MFSAGHLDTHSSHCSPHLPIPCSFFTQIPPNYLADLWPSGRLLESVPSLHSLMDFLINYFTLIMSIPSSLCLTHFLYKYSLWKKNSLDAAWTRHADDQCVQTVNCSFICITFPSVCWQKKKRKKKIFNCPFAAGSRRKASGGWFKGGLTVSGWLQRRRVMWGKVVPVPWGHD